MTAPGPQRRETTSGRSLPGPAITVRGATDPWPAPTGHARWWQGVPLQVKLISAVLAMVAIALAIIGAASTVALQRYLIGQVDDRLRQSMLSLSQRELPQPCHQIALLDMPSDYLVAIDSNCHSVLYYTYAYYPGDLPDLPTNPAKIIARQGAPFTVSSLDGSPRWRLLVMVKNDGTMLTVGEDLTHEERTVARLALLELLIGFSVLALLAMAGVWLVRASLRPLRAMEHTAVAIAGGDLGQRVPELDQRTELGQLSAALNSMLEQIEQAFRARAASETAARAAETAARAAADSARASESRALRSEERMRQFIADASHELRTPLTTIRGFAELYRQGASGDPNVALSRIEGEAARMGLLVEDLLLLARLDEERPLRLAPVRLADLVLDAAAAAHAVAPDRAIDTDVSALAHSLVVRGDEARLRQVIGNLVTNAVTHTPAQTPVSLRLRGDDGHAVVEVADSGPGLTAEQTEKVFERFYRVDKARTRQAARTDTEPSTPVSAAAPHSGAGLGLAIVAALVAAHGGTVEVDTAPGSGATFRVRLPLADTD
jgi:two-component system, OmpR family, sensor kinase